MDCGRWRELASEYIEGALAPPLAQAMASHAASCPACQTDEALLKAVSRELNVLPTVDPPLFFRENVMAAIERERTAKAQTAWWGRLPQLGRVAAGTALAGGLLALATIAILNPSTSPDVSQTARASIAPAAPSLLPGADAASNEPEPRLRVSRATTVVPGRGPAFSFSVWLENAERGTARFRLPEQKQDYRFNLFGNAAETLQVPFDVAGTAKTLDLHVLWTANGLVRSRELFVPVPGADDKAPEERQSFGLPQGNVQSTAREIAARYGRPVTLDGVPEISGLQVVAREETALEVLQRSLTPHGLRVTESRAGLLVEKADDKAASVTPSTP